MFRKVFSFSIQSILEKTDSLQEKNKTRRDDRLSSSHHSILWGEIPTKKNPVMTTQFFQKCTITALGNVMVMQSIGKNFPEHKIEDCNFSKQSHMQSSYTEIASTEQSLKTEIEYCSKDSQTPQPAPKVTLKSNWHSQQQQQQSLCDGVSTRTRKLVTGQSKRCQRLHDG